MTKAIPLYQTIIDYFLHELVQKRLAAGDKLPTEIELAERFQVSRITVIRAMKELEHLKLVYRVKGRGTFIREDVIYQDEYKDADKADSSVPSLISIVMSYTDQVGQEVLLGIEKAAHRHNFYVTFHNSLFDAQRERELLQKLIGDVQGIIIYPISGLDNIDIFSEMMIKHYPFVVIDHPIEGIEAPLFSPNNFQGSYDITRHLIESGHTKIAFMAPGLYNHPSLRERYKGYSRAMIEAGIPMRSDWLITKETTVRMQPEQFQLEINGMLNGLISGSKRPTAIVAGNDILASHLIKAAIQGGIDVPNSLSITGFDNLTMTEYIEVPLTTVEQPFFQIGEMAAEAVIKLILKAIETPVSQVLETKLIIRNSTAAPMKE